MNYSLKRSNKKGKAGIVKMLPIISKRQAGLRVIMKFNDIVRAEEKRILHQRGQAYLAYIREKYPLGEPRYKREDGYRVMIHTRDVQRYLQVSRSTAFRKMQEARDELEKTCYSYVKVTEFCKVHELDEEDVRIYLKKMDKKKNEEKKKRQAAKLAAAGRKIQEMKDDEIFIFEQEEKKINRKNYNAKRLKKAKNKNRDERDGYGAEMKNKDKGGDTKSA
jgi:hypothetical protein